MARFIPAQLQNLEPGRRRTRATLCRVDVGGSGPHSGLMRLITQTGDLQDLCRAFAEQPFVAVDTEFMRETTYWPKLCLIQAASPVDEAVIDPLAEGLDLSPFLDLLRNQNVLKVFHAARQDLEIFLKLAGQLPAPLFDTQIAAMA